MDRLIGVIPLYDDEKDSYWMVPGYFKMLEECGAIPVMLPLTEDNRTLDYFVKMCGGFLITGGHDVSPEIYGEKRRKACGVTCETRDRMECYLMKQAAKKDIPVLGICRGIQIMNACFGGTLFQDLPSEYSGEIEHHMSAPYNRTAHDVIIEKESLLYEIIRQEKVGVNSYHHQAVKKLAAGFQCMAVSTDGLIEGICLPDKKFFAAVQWHPEFFYKEDENCRKLVQAFVNAVE